MSCRTTYFVKTKSMRAKKLKSRRTSKNKALAAAKRGATVMVHRCGIIDIMPGSYFVRDYGKKR